MYRGGEFKIVPSSFLKDYDVLETKIKQVKKDFRDYFTRKVNAREIVMVNAINKLIVSDSLKKESALLSQVRKLILKDGEEDSSDAEIINYKNWIRDKLPA